MKRRRVFVWWLSAGLVATLLLTMISVVVSNHHCAPSHAGKPILEWAAELNGPNETASATAVFQEIGPEAAPLLAKAATRADPLFRPLVLYIGERLPDKWRVRLYQSYNPNKHDRVRVGALSALEIMGAKAEAATPELLGLLTHPQRDISYRAAHVLGRIGAPALPGLSAALDGPDLEMRLRAIYAITRIGPEAHALAPKLAACLKEAESLRLASATALARIGKPSVSVLIPLVNHESDRVRRAAIKTLGEIGPPARDAVSALLGVAQEAAASPHIRAQALEALSRIWPRGIVGAFAAALDDPVEDVRVAAAKALRAGGRESAPAISELVAALEDPSSAVRGHAALALGAIGRDAAGAAVALRSLANDPDPYPRSCANKALAALR